MSHHLEDDIFDAPRARKAATRRERRAASGASRRRRGCAPIAMLLAGLLLLGGVLVSLTSVRSLLPSRGPDTSDYSGPGTGQVEVSVESGESGAQIGATLEEKDVVKSAGAFVAAAAAEPAKAAKIQPGTYQLKKQMRAADAFAALADPKNRTAQGITIAEGLWRSEIYAKLAEGTGLSAKDYEAAEKSPQLELPAEAKGDVEGWLFPATYEFEKGTSAVEQLNAMIAKTTEELETAKVPREKWHRTLTVASIVEGESGAADRAKVARVIENRLADTSGPTVGMLNMDSTVHYIFQERGKAGTTDEMRASDSPYNTYTHVGLPPGPINNPGVSAIEAAAAPADGPWLFFVTVDPDTGETKFATTQREHDNNVKEFEAWCSANQDRC